MSLVKIWVIQVYRTLSEMRICTHLPHMLILGVQIIKNNGNAAEFSKIDP
jgi:hypothetical protein